MGFHVGNSDNIFHTIQLYNSAEAVTAGAEHHLFRPVQIYLK